MRVEQLMHARRRWRRVVDAGTPMRDVIYEMSRKGLGMTCVRRATGGSPGIITDGDLRRRMNDGGDVLDLRGRRRDDPQPDHDRSRACWRRRRCCSWSSARSRRSSSATERRRRRRRCTCTTSGAPSCSDDARSQPSRARAGRVRLLLLDVDGVLTDGTIVISGDGTESKRFDIKDGAAIVWAQRARPEDRPAVGATLARDRRGAPPSCGFAWSSRRASRRSPPTTSCSAG